jgi:hypothetical protein
MSMTRPTHKQCGYASGSHESDRAANGLSWQDLGTIQILMDATGQIIVANFVLRTVTRE